MNMFNRKSNIKQTDLDVPQEAERNLVFALYDEKAKAYQNLSVQNSIGVAVRGLTVACQNPESFLAKFPADYSLYHVGNFDERTGRVYSFNEPRLVVRCTELISKPQMEVSNA